MRFATSIMYVAPKVDQVTDISYVVKVDNTQTDMIKFPALLIFL